jgi:hypothetical protein
MTIGPHKGEGMRSTKMTSAVAAAAALLALAPAGAAAANKHIGQIKHRAAGGTCHVSLFAEPHIVASGESAQLFGQLLCPGGASTTGQTVTVYVRSALSGGFHVLGTATSAAGGFYSILAPALAANSVFYANANASRSVTRAVKVAPIVSFEGPAQNSTLLTGKHNVVTFKGTVKPEDRGAEVLLQRENSTSFEEWHAIQRGLVGEGGAYTFVHKFVVPGDANLRVIVRAHRRVSFRGVSETRSYVISQAENPNLTLESTQDPIPFGQAITLHGVVKGGANQPVTLFARKRLPGAPFTPVGTTTADNEGKYSFGEAPQENTSYHVTSGKFGSAILFEGVKYVLTANIRTAASASPTSVQSGDALTFSGTVSPVEVGHVVYVERENTFGGGFHVVDVGTVAAGGTYSIEHRVYGQGKQVFRVKVPGDPANQAVSSPTFTLEVTPAPGQALRPVAPAKLPGEGQI